MKYFFLLLIIFLIQVSCNKETPEIRDEIFHIDIPNDSTITVIDSIIFNMSTFQGEGCIEGIIVNEQNYFDLDIDQDNILDFRLQHNFYRGENIWWSPHYPCDTLYYFQSTIESISEKSKIFMNMENHTYPCYPAIELHLNNPVPPGYSVDTLALIYTDLFTPYFPDSTTFYIGIMMQEAEGNRYGWIHIEVYQRNLIIKEYAINMTYDRPIYAGQY